MSAKKKRGGSHDFYYRLLECDFFEIDIDFPFVPKFVV